MAICKFFQTGSCRFGTKCANEHFDVKALIKTEVESALKGSQWPISCFGPFKEKPCIPNFIDDQSFEEIRHACYEARKQNCFPSYQQQFNSQVMDAQNKMKALLSLDREVVDIVTQIYDSSEAAKATNPQSQSQSNPFAIGGTSAPGANQNIFAKGSSTQPVSNIFGSARSSFGSVDSAGSIFGQATNTGLLGQSVFGGGIGGGTQVQPSIFGQQQQLPQATAFNQSASTAVPVSNIFGMTPGQPPQSHTASIFESPQQQPAHSPFVGTNIFGAQQSGGNIFAQAVQSQQQSQPISGGNIFAQPTQQIPSQNQQFGNFNQSYGATAQQAAGANIFVQPHQQASAFGVNAQQQQNIFIQQQQQQPQQTTSAFGSQQQTGIFAATVSHIEPQNSINFGQNQQQSAFGQQPNTFQQNASNLNVPGNPYSKMESLTPEQIEAFKADTFILGKIPLVPPPRELC